MKKSKLYTRQGDDGTTSLVGGHRVSKTHPRLEAYGTIDELNSFIGLLITEIEDADVQDLLLSVQRKLFAIGSSLATELGTNAPKLGEGSACVEPAPPPCIPRTATQHLEQAIDLLDSKLPAMKGFVIPGGCRSAALAHVCRTVCRRAERQIYLLNKEVLIDKSILVFINRLSDLLFVIARQECVRKNIDEIIWDNRCI